MSEIYYLHVCVSTNADGIVGKMVLIDWVSTMRTHTLFSLSKQSNSSLPACVCLNEAASMRHPPVCEANVEKTNM